MCFNEGTEVNCGCVVLVDVPVRDACCGAFGLPTFTLRLICCGLFVVISFAFAVDDVVFVIVVLLFLVVSCSGWLWLSAAAGCCVGIAFFLLLSLVANG